MKPTEAEKDELEQPKTEDQQPPEAPPEGEVKPEGKEEAEEAPEAAGDDPLLKTIFRDMNPEADIKPAPEGDEPEPAAAPEKATESEKPEEKPKAEPPKKKKSKVAVVDTESKKFIDGDSRPPEPPEPEATKRPAQPTDEDQYVAGLTDEQQDELREAEVAERLFPDKYKDRKKKLLDWYKSYESGVGKLLDADPEASLDDSNADFQKLFKSKPSITPADYKKTAREIATEEARAKVNQDLDPKIEELNRKTRELEIAPQVGKFVEESFGEGIKAIIEGDDKSPLGAAFKVLGEKGPEEFYKEYPLEAAVTAHEMQQAKTLVREYLMLTKGAAKFSEANPHHKQVVGFIDQQGAAFKAQGGKLTVREGKQFLPRREFNALLQRDQAEAKTLKAAKWETARYWSFSDAEVVDMIALQTKSNIENRVQFEEKQAEARGFVRVKKPNLAESPKKTKPEPQEINPPKATAKPMKQGDKPESGEGSGISVLSLFPQAR